MDPFVRAALYLAGTTHLVVAIGVAVIHGRDPAAMVAAASTLEEAFPGRFVLGLGVSHRGLVEARGHQFTRPLAAMAAYLEAMDRFDRRRLPPRVLGALGPKMVALAGTAADGVHTYLAPVAHTATARATLGPDRWLAPTQLVAVDPDPDCWRDSVRPFLRFCLSMPNYTRHLLRFGLSDADLATMSDALVDAVVVPDHPDALPARVEPTEQPAPTTWCSSSSRRPRPRPSSSGSPPGFPASADARSSHRWRHLNRLPLP